MRHPPPDVRDPELDGPGNMPSSKKPQKSSSPAWLSDARWYYSLIGAEFTRPGRQKSIHTANHPVRVFDATDRDEVSAESPGTLCLRLEPQGYFSPRVRLLDAAGRETGVIRPEGIMPGVKYVLHRNSEVTWTLSVRSLVRKRHELVTADGDRWTIDTPFMGWYHVMGTNLGVPRLVGTVGPAWWGVWQFWIEPGRDTIDLLAVVSFLHRQWSRM